MLTPETIEGLRASVAKDIEAARLLDRAASLIDRGWTKRTDAVTGHGIKVSPHSKRARCWCMLGALRAAPALTGIARLVDVGAFSVQFECRYNNPEFGGAVMSRALWAAARLILGHDPKPHADTQTIVTQWNDTEAETADAVAKRLRDAAALVQRRIDDVRPALGGEDG